jgi:transcriptional regulator with XRE-family HTH domain
MEGSTHIRSAQDIAARLRHTREALGLNQREFAIRADLKANRYSQYETGVRPLTIEAALNICEQYGVTLDWLYRGDRSTLPHRLAIEIAHVEAADR